MANPLSKEKSLYLQQHAENPVQWWAWGEDAMNEAKRLNKPILLSIGYSSCHWCHVMARECFEDDYIAGLMHEHFVCIKVDREERPDVDSIYMDILQLLGQPGGWPLNVFCLPDGRPFFGGTYFPPSDKGLGIIPWPQLLMRISEHYKKNPGELIENAENVIKNLESMYQPEIPENARYSSTTLMGAAQVLAAALDTENGGFGNAPKFPPSMSLDYLLSIRNTRACETSHDPLDKDVDRTVLTTLDAMANRGLYDQIGSGFMRYCVDKEWATPHFEKMLYDNALLIDIYTKGWLRYKKPIYKSIVTETVKWLLSAMRIPNGGFAASFSAESNGIEGQYYLWKPIEVKAILGEVEGEAFCAAYNITEEGTFESGWSLPNLKETDFETREKLAGARQKLLEGRQKRQEPPRDNKQLLFWNTLAVKALCHAGYTFNRKDWLKSAIEVAEWIEATYHIKDNRYQAICYGESSDVHAFLNDYASYAQMCLSLASKVDWLEPGLSAKYIAKAEAVTEVILNHFGDEKAIGLFFSADDNTPLFIRKKEWLDNATPSGNSSFLHVLSELYAVTQKESYLEAFKNLRQAYVNLIVTAPNAIAHALTAIAEHETGIIVLKFKYAEDLEKAQDIFSKQAFRKIFIFLSEEGDFQETENSYILNVRSRYYDSFKSVDEVLENL